MNPRWPVGFLMPWVVTVLFLLCGRATAAGPAWSGKTIVLKKPVVQFLDSPDADKGMELGPLKFGTYTVAKEQGEYVQVR
jgi:hypothetical protein